jgi:Zn-dependent metalloprotease
MSCQCFIIPKDVLERYLKDRSLPEADRKQFADAANFESEWRKARAVNAKLAVSGQNMLESALQAVFPPPVLVSDCKNGTMLSGTPVADPGSSSDSTAKRAFDETKAVANFYKQIFGRNSLDNNGKTLLSSTHFGVKYNNAF